MTRTFLPHCQCIILDVECTSPTHSAPARSYKKCNTGPTNGSISSFHHLCFTLLFAIFRRQRSSLWPCNLWSSLAQSQPLARPQKFHLHALPCWGLWKLQQGNLELLLRLAMSFGFGYAWRWQRDEERARNSCWETLAMKAKSCNAKNCWSCNALHDQSSKMHILMELTV